MVTYRCCKHCCPNDPHHPAQPDAHTTPCGPAWCTAGSEPTPAAVQEALPYA